MSIDELRVRWEAALAHRGQCPRCAGWRVWHNGIRLRSATVLEEHRAVFVADIPVRRLRCGACGARWSHLPVGVMRRGHYQACVVASATACAVVDGEAKRAEIAQDHGCDRRTITRWIEHVAAIADPAMLGRALVAESATPILPAPPPTRVSRSARLSALGARAIAVLALLEALASLRGLEPPALAHASRLVPASAAWVAPTGGAASGA